MYKSIDNNGLFDYFHVGYENSANLLSIQKQKP